MNARAGQGVRAGGKSADPVSDPLVRSGQESGPGTVYAGGPPIAALPSADQNAGARARWDDGLDPRFDPLPADNMERQLYRLRESLIELDGRIAGLKSDRRKTAGEARGVEQRVYERRRKRKLESVEEALTKAGLSADALLRMLADNPRALDALKSSASARRDDASGIGQ
ncbi:MAG: hypothetical protein ACT60Q_00450 [Ferrovibrionaceae bacterium]